MPDTPLCSLTAPQPGRGGRRLTAWSLTPQTRGLELCHPMLEFSSMTTPSDAVEIYCVKCKAKTGSKDIEAVTMKNGRPATRSTCTECGTRKFRIGVLP